MAGVATGISFSQAVESYDPATNTWTARAPMPNARVSAAGIVLDGLLYVVGGVDIIGNALSTVEVYNPATNSWRTLSGLPKTAGELAGGAIKGVLYTAGGYSSYADVATTSAYYP